MYVIQREDGRFVTRPGSRHSYTAYLQNARVWSTREAAEAERCENESVLSIESVLSMGGEK